MVVGTSAENHGVREEMVDELQDFMYTSFFRGVTLDYSEFTNTLAVIKDSDELARRRLAEEERSARRKGMWEEASKSVAVATGGSPDP